MTSEVTKLIAIHNFHDPHFRNHVASKFHLNLLVLALVTSVFFAVPTMRKFAQWILCPWPTCALRMPKTRLVRLKLRMSWCRGLAQQKKQQKTAEINRFSGALVTKNRG